MRLEGWQGPAWAVPHRRGLQRQVRDPCEVILELQLHVYLWYHLLRLLSQMTINSVFSNKRNLFSHYPGPKSEIEASVEPCCLWSLMGESFCVSSSCRLSLIYSHITLGSAFVGPLLSAILHYMLLSCSLL